MLQLVMMDEVEQLGEPHFVTVRCKSNHCRVFILLGYWLRLGVHIPTFFVS